MPQIINTNIASLTAQRNLNSSQSANGTALERLSSGLRINSAKDDAAGLAISTKFESQVKGLNVAIRNAGDGISLAQTAEGALGAMTENLQRIRELAVQSSNATNSEDDRVALQQEVKQLLSEVSRTASETNFNGRNLLDGSFEGTFQIGADAGQTVDVSISELTAEKLGSSATAGVSAIGTSQDLANGDLTINGIAIEASKAGDDTASTDNAAASAISKAAAINAKSDETGVTAYVDKNVVSGAEMTGATTSGTLKLNGVEIDLQTTVSTSQTRASVAEAINAVSNQTGVIAVNSESDVNGLQLVAEDGRNIQVQFNSNGTGNLTSASTGLAIDGAGTYEGGYTLVADPDVGKIEITGGNGTGRGDLSNAGLTAGTYERGVATSVTEVTSSDLTATSVGGGSLSNAVSDSGDNGTLISGTVGTQRNIAASAGGGIGATANFIIDVDGTTSVVSIDSASTNSVASAAELLDAVAGVDAYERIEFNITDFDTNTGGATLYLGASGTTIQLADDNITAYDTQSERLQYLTEQINTTNFGADVTVTAELSQSKDSITVVMENRSNTLMRIGVSTAAGFTATDASGNALAVPLNVAAAASADNLAGDIAFTTSSGAAKVDMSAVLAAGAGSSNLFQGVSFSASDNNDNVLASVGLNEINVSVDGVAQTSQTLAANSTVADLAKTINDNYSSDVRAWEEVTLTIDASNLEVGDTIVFGSAANDLTTTGTGGGVAVAVTDASLSGIVDDINSTDFTGTAGAFGANEGIEVSAVLADDGNSFTLTIKNFTDGAEIGAQTNAEGRSLQISGGELIGSVQQNLSGELKYASVSGAEVDITIADPDVGGEFYAGNSDASSFAGVNGLEDGDVLINGVTIGAAIVTEDTSSAEFASDGTRIVSSSKELSGIAIAAAINEVSAETGVEATVNATEVVGGDGTNADTTNFAVGDTAEIYINGYSAGIVTLQADGSGAIDTDRAKADAFSLINGISGKTGVDAVDNGVSLTLTAEDGRNISIAIDDQSGNTDSIGALFGMDAAVKGIGEATFASEPVDGAVASSEGLAYQTTYSTVTLESAGEYTITAGSKGADELADLGLKEGSYGGASDGTFLKDIDISTFQGAQDAISAIDNALQSVASQRAELGALQNRFESTSSNLQITSENLSAANSRIRDADFAAETAELSRTQVLQQAGISILAQANQRPQQVLSLLG